jgi:hypothetical protein
MSFLLKISCDKSIGVQDFLLRDEIFLQFLDFQPVNTLQYDATRG